MSTHIDNNTVQNFSLWKKNTLEPLIKDTTELRTDSL